MNRLWILTYSIAIMVTLACVDITPPPADDDTPMTPAEDGGVVDPPADETPDDDSAGDPPSDDMPDDVTEPVETGPTRVRFETTVGDILIEVEDDDAPITVANFVQYVEDGFYDGGDDLGATIFHRIVPGFVIQGGGFTEDFAQKETRDPIINEADNALSNERGTLSMARTSDPDSGTSQFFVNLIDNGCLDFTATPDPACPTHTADGFPGHTVFGRVVEGMDVVDAIGASADVVTVTSAVVVPQ